MRLDDLTVRINDLLVWLDRSAVRLEAPAIRIIRPAAWLNQPAVPVNEPAVRSDEPAVRKNDLTVPESESAVRMAEPTASCRYAVLKIFPLSLIFMPNPGSISPKPLQKANPSMVIFLPYFALVKMDSTGEAAKAGLCHAQTIGQNG